MISIPTSQEWESQLRALQESGLYRQHCRKLHDYRCWQAAQMGFLKCTIPEAVKLLMGESYNEVIVEGDWHRPYDYPFEWFYNHHAGVVKTGKENNVKINWHHYTRQRFFGPLKWRCTHKNLDYINKVLPPNLVERINELKKLRFFNAFTAVVTCERKKFDWIETENSKIIVLANLFELPEPGGSNPAQRDYFYMQ